MYQNDAGIHKSIEPQSIDEVVEHSLSRLGRRYFWRIINIIFTSVGVLGLIFFNQARDEHRILAERLTKLEKVVEEKTGETEEIRDYLQIIEKKDGNLLNYFEVKKDEEAVRLYREMMKELQNQKQIYENRRLQKEK